MSDITINLASGAGQELQDMEEGESAELTIQVTSNDGQTLKGTITSCEPGETEQDEEEEEEPQDQGEDEGAEPGDRKPMAVIAMGMKKR